MHSLSNQGRKNVPSRSLAFSFLDLMHSKTVMCYNFKALYKARSHLFGYRRGVLRGFEGEASPSDEYKVR
jgi:hypothetical protein